jgi:signal transduction histidine kinase
MARERTLFRGLTGRFLWVLVILVLTGSLALLALLGWGERRRELVAFGEQARANAAFVERAGLPRSSQLAGQLGVLLGCRVYFRGKDGGMVGVDGRESAGYFAGGQAGVGRELGRELVAEGDAGEGWRLALVRERGSRWAVAGPVAAAVVAFVLMALLAGWWLARGLIRPLRSLASMLPRVESLTEWPGAGRADEIGELARALAETGKALREERSKRERAERHAVLGRMAASLAHEVRNPVSAIHLHGQLLSGVVDEGGRESAACIVREAGKIEGLVQQWMLLAKPEPPVKRLVGAAEVLMETAAMLEPAARLARVKLATDAGPAGCGVLGDRVRLGQALANVLQNAIHASPEGGTVTVVVREEGREVIWEVSDEGPGFSVEAQGRWHEPFYSGKEGGMGLGLTVAGEVMVAHGGCVAAGPRPGGGAVVTLRMPAAKDEPEQSS